MAVEFIQAVWELSPYKAEKLLVQLACADWANYDGEFWPTYDDIAHKARLTKPGAIGVMQQMIEDGEVVLVTKSTGGRGNRNRYCFSEEYLQAVEKIRETWTGIRERKGKRPLPKQEQEKVNEPYPIKTEKVNEDDGKGKPELSHIRNNRHKPSEERGVPSAASLICSAYENIATDYKSQTRLQEQIVQLNDATPAQVEEWLKSRRGLSAINFIAQDFKTWLVNQSRKVALVASNSDAAPALRYNCAKCQDRFVYTLNGKPQQCDCWQKQEVAA